MRVEQIMARPVQVCGPEDSLAHAAQLMWDHDCGCLPVVAGGGGTGVAGMITDRDICMCALFQKRPLEDLRVSTAMATQVQVCRPYDDLRSAEKIMSAARIRRLPVVDDDGALVGMISLADLAQEALRERDTSKREISEKAVGHTLAAICRTEHRELAA
jgi:CBS domain-containing protein